MPAPTTLTEFLDLVRKSGVVDESRLTAYLKQQEGQPDIPTEPSKYAGIMVRDGLLTFFQAEQFLQGKWKRFTIGKYRVLERLGSGGMGQVFLCEHKVMRRKVALKVLPTAKAEEPASLERFHREARAVAALDHPNLVRAYDVDQEDNLHFLVMEYIDGASLQEIVKKCGPVDVTRCCHYIYWSAIGLQYAHDSGLIHRDIKPGNILIDRLGTVKILDLGLARFFNDDEDMLTKKYDENVLGTADYLAPEQALDSHNIDGRADVYSLGATFYFMLVGHQPFMEGTVAQKLLWHQNRNPTTIKKLRPDVPDEVIAIVERMMSKKKEDRYQTPHEVADALTPFIQTPIGPPPEKEMPQLSAAVIAAGGGTMSSGAGRSMATRVLPRQAPPVNLATPGSGLGGGSGSGNQKSGGSGNVTAPPAVVDSADTVRPAPLKPIVETNKLGDSDRQEPVWEAIGSETNATSKVDTDDPVDRPNRKKNSPSKSGVRKSPVQDEDSSSSRPGRAKAESRSAPLLWIFLGLLLLGGAGFGVWWFGIRTPGGDGQGSGQEQAGARITVGKQGAQYRTILAALPKAPPNSRIVLMDDEWEEELSLSRNSIPKGLTIESAEGKRVNWKLPSASTSRKIMELSGPEGLRLKGIRFDGGGKTANGLLILGKAAGLSLEDLEFVGFAEAGVRFVDVSGDEKNPVQIIGSRFTTAKANNENAVQLAVSNATSRPGLPATSNQHILIQDCRFVGPFVAGVVVEGSATDVELRRNRFFQLATAVQIKESKGEHSVRLTVAQNTFHTITGNAVHFLKAAELAHPNNAIRQRVNIQQNYFAGVGAIVLANDRPAMNFLLAADNARTGSSKEGHPDTKSVVMDAALPVDPQNDSTFLRYDKNSPLMRVGPNVKPVGVPPTE